MSPFASSRIRLGAAVAVAAALASGTAPASAAPPTQVTSTSAPPTSPVQDDAPPPAVYGLLPLWEHTGVVEESGAARIGLRHAQVGIGPLTAGTDPYLDLYGTLNATGKLGIVRRGPIRLALQLAWYRIPTAAESRGIGNLHASALANPYAPVILLPAAVAGSWLATRRLHLHGSATMLQSLSEHPEMQLRSGGLSAWLEWWASPTRSARIHAGAEGWPAATRAHAGISFGWRARHFALQGGYARRFAPEGTSANFVMLDGALVFP
jgi:hypothetical protein